MPRFLLVDLGCRDKGSYQKDRVTRLIINGLNFMPHLPSRSLGLSLKLFVLSATALVRLVYAQTDAEQFFESKVRPILANNCYTCHTGAQSGGLRLDSREAIL